VLQTALLGFHSNRAVGWHRRACLCLSSFLISHAVHISPQSVGRVAQSSLHGLRKFVRVRAFPQATARMQVDFQRNPL
jgi:hypothetical protein